MKLLFPNGEHAPVELAAGKTIVGSTAAAKIVLLAPGIAPQHCEFDFNGHTAQVRILHPDNIVSINGIRIKDKAELKPGDLIVFSEVRARAVAVEKAAPAPVRAKEAPVDDDGRTKVRMALPKYVLRGVSGPTFGKVFPVHGTVTIGRQNDCEIPIPSEEVSRRHAELRLTPDGVMVEDLGSSNGTYVNDKRITRQVLKPGDELRLDTIRFLLLAPGQEAPAARADAAPAAPARPVTPVAATGGGSKAGLMWGLVAVALVAVAAVATKVLGLW